MNSYEEKKQARIDYYREKAEKAEREAEQFYKSAKEISDYIPFGQPILVGHHSEKRHRSDLKKINSRFDKARKAQEKAEYYRSKAFSAESNKAISSDDPEAIEKIKKKIEKLEGYQQYMKDINKAWKKNGEEGLKALGLSEKTIEGIKKTIEVCSWDPKPCPRFQLSNNSANIRRLKKRLEQLEKKANAKTVSRKYPGDIEVVENVEENRIQIFFPGKPSSDVIRLLKGRGFRWSRYNQAWQRHLNTTGIWAAEAVLKAITNNNSNNRKDGVK